MQTVDNMQISWNIRTAKSKLKEYKKGEVIINLEQNLDEFRKETTYSQS
jgi:hypothetical protein